MRDGKVLHTMRGHTDEVLDVTFNTTGSRVATAGADGQARVYNTITGACQSVLEVKSAKLHSTRRALECSLHPQTKPVRRRALGCKDVPYRKSTISYCNELATSFLFFNIALMNSFNIISEQLADGKAEMVSVCRFLKAT